jgi:UDP-GlcNAc:undecaprenyl-phosphate GlcNAc-1-phosphate transferase
MPFFIAIALALVLTWAARRVGLATGLVDRPPLAGSTYAGELKIHTVPIPVLGGLGVMVAVPATMLLEGYRLPVAVTAGVALAAAIGLVDDARPLPASVRMVALAAAGTLVAGGLELGPLGPLARPGVVVLLLLLANAVNLIDGQDGLAGGLGAIACAGLTAVITANGGDPLVAIALAGALVGFLAWNLPETAGIPMTCSAAAAATGTARPWRCGRSARSPPGPGTPPTRCRWRPPAR